MAHTRKNVRTQTHEKVGASASPAEALIAAAKVPSGLMLSPEARAALTTLAAHNDALPRHASVGRVSARAAIAMLAEHYGVALAESSRSTFDALVRRELGRRSWGTA